MAALERRTAAVDLSEPCASCGRPLAAAPPAASGASGGALPPCLLFPTGNGFHGACACAEAAALAAPQVAGRIRYLQQTLAQVGCLHLAGRLSGTSSRPNFGLAVGWHCNGRARRDGAHESMCTNLSLDPALV